ncbi:cancer-associated gene 1 protein [Ctenodactylus gundi]
MSGSDAMNVSGLSQDLTHSESALLYEETSATTSFFLKNEAKNVKRENESKPTSAEEIYSTQDNLLGDTSTERSYSKNIQIQPGDTSLSSMRQFEPICKFHWIEAFNDEMFQNSTEGFSYSEKLELQSHMYNYAKDTNIMQDSLREENSKKFNISTNKDQLVHECVRQPSSSPSPLHCSDETLQFMEKSLSKSTALERALNSNQHQSFLCEESVPRNAEDLFYNENSFNLLDLRVSYKTEETDISSKEIQNSQELPEMSVSHLKEVTVEDKEGAKVASAWSPGSISRSGAASWENCATSDTEQSFRNLQPLEEDMALNEILQRLKHTNRMQQVQIQDLQHNNRHLEKKVKELQMKITKQEVFVDIINQLKENMEELIEDKYNIMLQKNDINKRLQSLQEMLANTKKHLQESRKEKETLQLQIKKIKINYVCLRERYFTEVQQRNISVSQCREMDRTLSKKEEEVGRLRQLRGDLEQAAASALDLLKREKEAREQEFLSLQEEYQKHEKESLKERRKLKLRVEKLAMQVKNLLLTCESEKAKNTKLQQQMDDMKSENAKLREQVARNEEQICVPEFQPAQLQEQLEAKEPAVTKGTRMKNSDLFLNCLLCEESLNLLDVKKTPHLASTIQHLMALVVGLLTCQDITTPDADADAEHFKDSKKVVDIMLQKLKSLHLKKKDLDKELLQHKDRITTFRDLITDEKLFQDHTIGVTYFDSDETKNVQDAPLLLEAKLDKYHNLNEELDFVITKLGTLLESKEDYCSKLIEENDKYQRHLGSLINKVASYEEIIKCADRRIEVSRSQIAHLEERNKHLEDLIRRPKDRAKKARRRAQIQPALNDRSPPATTVGDPLSRDRREIPPRPRLRRNPAPRTDQPRWRRGPIGEGAWPRPCVERAPPLPFRSPDEE